MTIASVITSPRRYYLLKSYAAESVGDLELQGVWRAKQLGAPSTALVEGFPSRAALFAAFYTTTADLNGASVTELVNNVRLTAVQAQAALDAL